MVLKACLDTLNNNNAEPGFGVAPMGGPSSSHLLRYVSC
jgi:hypothetical protein